MSVRSALLLALMVVEMASGSLHHKKWFHRGNFVKLPSVGKVKTGIWVHLVSADASKLMETHAMF